MDTPSESLEPEDDEGFWKPHDRQAEFLAIPPIVDEGFYGGAAGGGKSEVLLLDPIVKQYHLHPRFQGIIFRRTFPELNESLIPRAIRFYKYKFGANWNSQDKVFTFPSGATIRMSYLMTDDDAHSHQSAEFNYAAFDELTHFSSYQYLYIKSRVRTSVAGLTAYMRSASNPGGPGHTWVFERFVKMAEDGGVLFRYHLPSGKVNRRIFIKALLSDNPTLLKNDPNYQANLETLPEAEKRALLYGDWHAFAGQVFSEFRAKWLPDEPENALHVIDPFPIPEWWPKIVVADWGWSAMTWVGFSAITPDGRVIIYREYSCKKTYIATWGADIKRLAQYDGNLKAFVLDPSAWAQRGEPKQIHQQVAEATGWHWEQADNDRIGGKLLLHEYLRWEPRPESYVPKQGYDEETEQRIYRFHGEKAAEQYRRAFEPQPPEDNLPKLLIFSSCPVLIQTIQACSPGKSNPEDVEAFDGDDPYDGTRYLIKRVHRYFEEAKLLQVKIARRGAILQKHEGDGDTTALYRRMEKLDADEAAKNLPLRRFHSAKDRRVIGRIGPRESPIGANRLSLISSNRKRSFAYRGRRAAI